MNQRDLDRYVQNIVDINKEKIIPVSLKTKMISGIVNLMKKDMGEKEINKKTQELMEKYVNKKK